jgi:sugar phosphate permease
VDQQATDRLYRKVTLRIIPFIFVCYLIAMVDRLNVGFAKLQFMSDLHLTETQFGVAASLLYFGYILFEVPSNLMMQRIGLGLTLLRIMTLWGAATLLLAFADSRFHFYGLRFLIGLAEAGFLPGVLLYLTYWFPERMRGRMTSFVMAALPVSGIIGGPLAGWIMTATHGMLGLKGWQYLFLIEGVPAIALGIFAYFFIARDPEHASWLDDSERAVLAKEIASGRGQTDGQPRSFAAALADKRVWGLALCYFTFYCVENALLVWIPTLLRSVGSVSIFQIGWISGAISLVSMVGMQLISNHSDAVQERRWHVIGCGVISGASFILLPFAAGSIVLTTAILMASSISVFAFLALFWTIPSAYLRGSSAAGGLALISSIGATGGIVSPIFIGWMKDLTGSFYESLGSMGVLLVLAMGLLYFVSRPDAQPAYAAAPRPSVT